MSTLRDQKRLLAILRDHGPLSMDELDARDDTPPRNVLVSVLTAMGRDGRITFDDDLYQLPEDESVRFMKRAPKDSPVDGTDLDVSRENSTGAGGMDSSSSGLPAPVANIAVERDRLVLEMGGPHALAQDAVASEPVLSERLQIAIADGAPPIDLVGVPRYRRAAAVEDGLNRWDESTRNGPCSICGTRTARRGWYPVGYLDAPTDHGFTTKGDGSARCDWCEQFLSQHSLADLRETVFNAVAGTRGIPAGGFHYRHSDALVPLASEVKYSGTPWGHLTGAYVTAIRKRALAVVHHTHFATLEAHARQSEVPGIPIHFWNPADIPLPEPRVLRTPREERVRKEDQQREADMRERAAREAERKAAQQKATAARDAKVAQMPPEQAEEYLREYAQEMARQDELHRQAR